MGTVVGFLLGYVFGSKQGGDPIAELKGSIAMITGSGEVQGFLATGMEAVKGTMAMVGNAGELQGLIAGGLTAARGLISSGGGLLAARMAA